MKNNILYFLGIALFGFAGFSLVEAGVTFKDWQFWAVIISCAVGSELMSQSKNIK